MLLLLRHAVQIGLRRFGAQTIARVVAASEEPGATRCGLARLLCELADWKDSKDRLALASARKVLPKVAKRAGFRLPAARPGVPDAAARVSVPEGLEAISALQCGIRDLGSLLLERVSEGDDRRCWEAMLEAWHPLGWKRAPGGQLRYWIRSSAYGVLAGIAGFDPTKRQPLPGTRKLREAGLMFKPILIYHRGMKEDK